MLISLSCHILFVGLILLLRSPDEPKVWPSVELITLGNGGTSLEVLTTSNKNLSVNKSEPVKSAVSKQYPSSHAERDEDIATKGLNLSEKRLKEKPLKSMAISNVSNSSDKNIDSQSDSPAALSKGTVGSSDGMVTQVRDQYYAHIEAVLQSAKEFPASASRLGQSGVVMVEFTVQRDGTILNPIVKKASDYSILNQAALKLLKKVRHFEPFPNAMTENSLVLIIPISYGL